jgi:hypothetical protein
VVVGVRHFSDSEEYLPNNVARSVGIDERTTLVGHSHFLKFGVLGRQVFSMRFASLLAP